jgi:hypothetical protein
MNENQRKQSPGASLIDTRLSIRLADDNPNVQKLPYVIPRTPQGSLTPLRPFPIIA